MDDMSIEDRQGAASIHIVDLYMDIYSTNAKKGPGSSSKGKGRATDRPSRETTTGYAGATWNPMGAGSSSGPSTIPISAIQVPAPTGQPMYASPYPTPSAYVPQAYPGVSGSIQPGPFPGPASSPSLQQPPYPYPAQYGPSSYQYSSSGTSRATPTSSFNPSSSANLATPTSSSNRTRRSPRSERLLSTDDWDSFLNTGVMSYNPPDPST
ncbi:hypothetical protein FS837_006092, partial [Tulasnella sp. UAMH 9824]